MRKETTFTATDRRERTPYNDFLRPPASNTVSSPPGGGIIITPGTDGGEDGTADECAGPRGLPVPLCPPEEIDIRDTGVSGGGGEGGVQSWHSIRGPFPPEPLGIGWPGGIYTGNPCWAEPYRSMGASAGHSGGAPITPGWQVGGYVTVANQTGSAPWTINTNYAYVSSLRLLGPSKPILSYQITNLLAPGSGCFDGLGSVQVIAPEGYTRADISFRYRLGGWKYIAEIQTRPPEIIVIPPEETDRCPDSGPQPPGTYSETLINSGGGIFTSRSTNLKAFIQVYFDGVLVIEGLDYLTSGNQILPLGELPSVVDAVYVI